VLSHGIERVALGSVVPGERESDTRVDLARARAILDEDHDRLADVKQRVVEELVLTSLNPEAKAPIRCLVGPPGVGKTSLGQSIARAW